jgi:hypothetical protein
MQPPAALEGRLGAHLHHRAFAVALVDHLALDHALEPDLERERDGPLRAELDAVGDQLGDHQLKILEHLRGEDLVEDLQRRAGLGGCVVGRWELEAELHQRSRP